MQPFPSRRGGASCPIRDAKYSQSGVTSPSFGSVNRGSLCCDFCADAVKAETKTSSTICAVIEIERLRTNSGESVGGRAGISAAEQVS